MHYRILGRTGLRVSEIGFGAMTIGGMTFGKTDDQESLRAINHAIDLGVNFFDTADSYGEGRSESLLAEVLKKRRHEMVVATKGGNQYKVRHGLGNFERGYITSALEASLRRLQIETIDLYQLHNPSAEVIKRGEIFGLLNRFKQEGKIRYFGVSAATVEDGLAAIESGKPDTVQTNYSILYQEPEERLFPEAQRANVGIIARVPLERGTLSGKYSRLSDFGENDFRRRAFSPELFARTLVATEKLRFLVKGDIKSLAEAALRFVLSHPAVSVVIPGIRNVEQVEVNVAASKGPLPTSDLARLGEMYKGEFQGLELH